MVAEQGLGASLLLCAVLVAAGACGPEDQAITSATGGTGGAGGTCQLAADAGECTILPLCGCATGKNCVLLDQSTGATACLTAGGVKENRGCASGSDCDVGLQCVSYACHRLCTSATDCGGAAPHCDKTLVSTIPDAGACATQCDLVNPSEFSVCGPGVNCVVIEKGSTVTDCRGTGKGVGKGDCPTLKHTECAPGYGCLDTFDCAKWCRSSKGAADCGAGQNCTAPAVTIGGEGFGFCQP